MKPDAPVDARECYQCHGSAQVWVRTCNGIVKSTIDIHVWYLNELEFLRPILLCEEVAHPRTPLQVSGSASDLVACGKHLVYDVRSNEATGSRNDNNAAVRHGWLLDTGNAHG